MGKWQQIIDYIHFIGRSNNSHGIHSPFVFNLYNEVLNVKKEYYFFGPIESLRASYHNNHEKIDMVENRLALKIDNIQKILSRIEWALKKPDAQR